VGTAVVTHELGDIAHAWNQLARRSGTPFVTHEWLGCWWRAFGEGEPIWLSLRGDNGALEAGAFLERGARGVTSAANVHSGDWDAVARDDNARTELWEALGELDENCIRLLGIPEQGGAADAAEAALQKAGYRIVRENRPPSPSLQLPATWEGLIHTVSRNLRSNWGRRQRGLERAGTVAFRTVTRPGEMAVALDAFLELEASGWKGKAGTAILSDLRTQRLYRDFAQVAAARGWLRLHLLELDGQLIAGDYAVSFEGTGFLLKTAFSEPHEQLSPGLVLRGRVLQAAIKEGLDYYDFLGGPERYKLSWASQLRPRVRISAYRGAALPRYAYRSRLHPVLRSSIGPIARLARDRVRRLRAGSRR